MSLNDSQAKVWGVREQITLRDVAKEAGVSTSAASVVLNGARSGTRISPVKRRNVLEVAERMGYRPNALAQSLSRGRTNRIGVYSGRGRLNSRNWFFAEVLGGIFDAASEFHINTMVHTSGYGDAPVLDLVSNRAIDGIVVHASDGDPILPLLGELRVPAVAIADVVPGLPCVVVDDAAGGFLQAQHLASLGHKHVILKRAPWDMVSTEARATAFEEAAERLGIRVTSLRDTANGDDVFNSAEIALICSDDDPVTAVVGWSDASASYACNHLTSLGIAIPDRVAVIGFDGFLFQPKLRHEITTIRAPWGAVGATATRILMQLIDHEPVPPLTVLPVEFLRGKTT